MAEFPKNKSSVAIDLVVSGLRGACGFLCIPEASRQLMRADIHAIALSVRERFEAEVQGDLEQLRDRCESMSRALVDELVKHGFKPQHVVGQYKGADADYEMDTSEMEEEDIENFDFDAGYAHWWVELPEGDGQSSSRILDICADQFHPSRRGAFRVVDVHASDSSYEWQDRLSFPIKNGPPLR